MSATEVIGTKRTHKHGDTPTGIDQHPAAAVSFGSRQDNIGNNPVSKQNKHHRSDDFGGERRHEQARGLREKTDNKQGEP